MPRISAFYGILVYMYYNDHEPPHFHAIYGDYEVLININDFSVYAGNLPPRAFGLLMEWASLHKEELLENWRLIKEFKSPKPINPLH